MIKAPHVQRAIDTSLAVRLIELGARVQLLEHEFPHFSRETVLQLYKEVHGVSPPKGLLPFSSDWFLTWQPNLHASLFLAYYEYFTRKTDLAPVEVLLKAYDIYDQEVSCYGNHDPKKPLFTVTRAWMLVRMMGGRNSDLTTARCHHCGGNFIVENHKTRNTYNAFVCGLCQPPARAGKTKKREMCIG